MRAPSIYPHEATLSFPPALPPPPQTREHEALQDRIRESEHQMRRRELEAELAELRSRIDSDSAKEERETRQEDIAGSFGLRQYLQPQPDQGFSGNPEH